MYIECPFRSEEYLAAIESFKNQLNTYTVGNARKKLLIVIIVSSYYAL